MKGISGMQTCLKNGSICSAVLSHNFDVIISEAVFLCCFFGLETLKKP